LAMTAFAVMAYGCGLPSMVPVFALIVASVHLHWSGWRIWRVVALQSAALTVGGEVAVVLDWLPTVTSKSHEHALAAVFLAAGMQALSNLGMTSRRREEMELELRRTESRFRALVQKSHEVVAIVDREGRLAFLSPAAARLTPQPVSDLCGRRLEDLVNPRAMTALNAAMIRTGGGETGAAEELEIMIGAGTEHARWLEIVVTNLLDDAAVAGFVLNAADVTERRRHREELVHAATHDPLTGLMNRSAFVTTLQRELAYVGPSNQAWLFFCDLDGFKLVNDGFGHDAGDKVLVHVAQQLRLQAGPRAVVGRFGGDEFCVLIPPGNSGHRDPHELRDRLAEAVAQPCRIPGGETVRVQASFGLVGLDGRQLLADEVLREADQRMYQRKRRNATPSR
jgi:diguanylate cyclase (GGDEF)-like protein/PAS domain S-box-containing protein